MVKSLSCLSNMFKYSNYFLICGMFWKVLLGLICFFSLGLIFVIDVVVVEKVVRVFNLISDK